MSRLTMLTVTLTAAVAAAYPISPATLWSLSERAHLVVVGTLVSKRAADAVPRNYKQASEGPGRAEDVVQVRVLQTLAGPSYPELEVHNQSGIICPAPARLEVGETALLFLTQSEASWSVAGRSYGALYPEPDELPVYVERLQAALALLAQGSPPTEAQQTDWLVATAAHPATRWHGLYPLASGLDDHSFYDTKTRAAPALSAAQRHRLAAAFIAAPTTDSTLGMALFVLRDEKDPALDAAFVGAFQTALAHGDASPFELHQALGLLLARFTRPQAVSALLGSGQAWDASTESLEKVWRTAREQLKLPEGQQVAPKRPPRVRGTGAQTPF